MTERILTISEADGGEYIYLSFKVVKGDDFSRNTGVNWLVIDSRLHLDITQQVGNRSPQVTARISSDHFFRATDGTLKVDTAWVTNTKGKLKFSLVVHKSSSKEKLYGHIATIRKGAIKGWVTDPKNTQVELPVEAEVAGCKILCMSDAGWVKTDMRSFSLPLPVQVAQLKPYWVYLRSHVDGVQFNRSPLILTLTRFGWLIGTPFRHHDNSLRGEFVLAPAPRSPVTITVIFDNNKQKSCECNQNSKVAFDNAACGFNIEGVTRNSLVGSRLKISHHLFKENPIEFNLGDFFKEEI